MRHRLSPDELWDEHGASLLAMASIVSGNEAEALLAVTRGMVDVFREAVPESTLRAAALSVYQHCQGPEPESVPPQATSSPLGTHLGALARPQRSALALCFFGGHSYRQAATAMRVTPDSAAALLIDGLHQLSQGEPAPDPA